jgi:hypothetical protein
MTDLVAGPAVDDPGLDDIAALLVATRLRNVFRVNALVSGSTGLACALAAPAIADVLEVERAPVALIGVGLVGFAVALGVLGAATTRRDAPGTRRARCGRTVAGSPWPSTPATTPTPSP